MAREALGTPVFRRASAARWSIFCWRSEERGDWAAAEEREKRRSARAGMSLRCECMWWPPGEEYSFQFSVVSF